MSFLREVGEGQADIVVKTDRGAEAGMAVIDDLAGLRPTSKTIRKEAPCGSSASNGVGRAVQSVMQQLEVMKLCSEGKWKSRIPDEHPVIPWLAEPEPRRLRRDLSQRRLESRGRQTPRRVLRKGTGQKSARGAEVAAREEIEIGKQGQSAPRR